MKGEIHVNNTKKINPIIGTCMETDGVNISKKSKPLNNLNTKTNTPMAKFPFSTCPLPVTRSSQHSNFHILPAEIFLFLYTELN